MPAALGSLLLTWASLHAYRAPGPLPEAQAILVPRGTAEAVAASLRNAGAVDSAWSFRLAANLTSGDGLLRAGEFAFPAHASLADILAVLRTARPIQHKVTIPEGLNVPQIAQLLDRAESLDGFAPPLSEGELLPDTYMYDRGTARAAIVAQAKAAMDRALAKAWADRAPGLPLAGPHDLLVLASIVERETSRPEERPHIAGVFLNRLRKGMRLQSDPTVAYAISQGQFSNDRGLTTADLKHDSPWNTYTTAGLPPGPIATPGIAALQATARPAATDDLYFVADPAGGHVFARTLEEHNRNVAAWRARPAEAATGASAPSPAGGRKTPASSAAPPGP